MGNNIRNFVCFSLLLAGSLTAHALTIVRNNDPSLAANLSPADVAAASAAFDYAAAQYSALYNDPVQVNITLAAVPGTGTLGESSTALVGFFSYTTIRNALIADAVSLDDVTAIATLPVLDPTGGHNWVTSRAQGKALGLIASDATSDGTFTFGAGFSYTYDPANRAVAGKFDFIGVAFHEISEIMGRIPGLGTNFGDGGPDYLPFDLFRYTGLAIRSFTGGSGNYFSIDNGTTDLKNFNFANGNGSDPQDWASGANDAYNAFSSSSVLNALTPVDVRVMDVIGYNFNLAPMIVAAGATLTAEGCTPTNGAIDPSETVTVNFALQNTGGQNAFNVVATLLATGGVTAPSGAQSYGTLVAGGGAVSEPFTFTANGTCASNITATLQIQTNSANYGTVTYNFNLGVLGLALSQNFDGVSAPALPAGWTTSAGGAESPWVTSTTLADTAPNAAFSPDPTAIGSNVLVSPVIPIMTSTAKLTFRNNYSLETGYDGGVLDIQIGGGSFQDIMTAGGSFVQNGYVATISTSFGNPIGGRMAWSGSSGGFLTTIVNLPAAAAGQNIQLRWMCGSDSSIGYPGWYIDTISIIDGFTCCAGGVSPASFQITSIVRSNNNILINWTTGGVGKTNALQATAGTVNGSYATNNFANIFIVTNAVTTSTNYTDVGAATNFPSRYYRVRLVP